jgi:hypothetical protein
VNNGSVVIASTSIEFNFHKVIRDHMESGCTVSATSPSMLEDDVAVIVLEVDMLIFSILENIITDRPRFTKQQNEIEQATMADEEKAATLCDLFGQSCAVGYHKQKRPD